MYRCLNTHAKTPRRFLLDVIYPIVSHYYTDKDVFLKKESDFVGKAAMVAAKEAGLKRKRIGFKAVGRGIARGDEEVMKDGKVIGYVTSGTHSPTLGYPIGMALVDTDAGVALGDKLTVTVRKKPVEVEVIKSQFLKN